MKEFYTSIGSDYEDVLYRLRSEERILKYLHLVTKDPSFIELIEAAENGDCDKMFIASHTIKGLALNFGLESLAKAASALTEYLRDGKNNIGWELLEERLEKEINIALDYIAQLD